MKISILTFLVLALGPLLGIFSLNPHDFPDYVSHLPNYTSEALPISFSGLAPLDKTKDNALFYWYFPAQSQPSSKAPTLLWLNGGPATSTTYNIFVENGPLRFKENKDGGYSVYTIDEPGKPRSWTAFYNVLYLDQPVGTGYSYTTTNNYPETQEEIAQNIWKALQYFMKIHPETIDTRWYFSGESYAGRFVPAITYLTLKYNDQIQAGKLEGIYVNLQGMIVSCGFILGVSQRVSSIESSQAGGLLHPTQLKQAKTIAAECQQLSGMGKNYTSQANSRCDDITTYVDAVSGVSGADVSIPTVIISKFGTPLNRYFNNEDVIKALHAENSKKEGILLFNASCKIAIQHLQSDRLSNSLDHINYILTRIPCLFFSGNFDALDGSYGTYEWFQYLEGSYPNIIKAPRNIWYINKEPVGFYSEHKSLTYVVVNSAGHYVSYSQLDATVKMVEIFTMKNNDWDFFSGFTPTPIDQVMGSFMKNCNGNGYLTEFGTCICDEGYGLGDCSGQAEDLKVSQIYDLNQREHLFFKIPLQGQDTLVQFHNEDGMLEIFVSASNGPVPDHEESSIGFFASKSAPKSHTIYLSSTGKKIAYLTVRNSDYLKPTKFSATFISIDPLNVKQQSKEDQNYLLGLNVKFISNLLYILSLILIIALIMILVQSKKNSTKLKAEAEDDVKKQLIL